MKVVVIIPAFNPDNKLINLVNELKSVYEKIIVVDDGSDNKNIFKKIENDCVILKHDKNYGKGRAIKTGLIYYMDNDLKNYCGVVLADADGQHIKEDIINVSNELEKNDEFILGTRLFNTKEVPFRNKIGNRITSWLFKKLYGIYLKDTQTGLRAIPNKLIPEMINISGYRFEYEMNVLTYLVKKKKRIVECDIHSVYLIDSNKKSHFKVIKDSYKIYKLMFKNRKMS